MKKNIPVIAVFLAAVAALTAVFIVIRKDKTSPAPVPSTEETAYRTEEATTAAPETEAPSVTEGELPTVPQTDYSGLVFSYPLSEAFSTSSERCGFSGFADKNAKLYCNGSEIGTSENGAFGFDVLLAPGDNVYRFENGGAEKTFTVTYRTKLISSVSPTGDVTASSGTVIDLTASGASGATVTASVGGRLIALEEKSPGSYSAEYSVPSVQGTEIIGKISFSAVSGSETFSFDGGTVTAVGNSADYGAFVPSPGKDEDTEVFTSLYAGGSYKMLTPYRDYGLGNAQYCEILKDNCESTPAAAGDDKSCPLTTPLLRGTFDRITGVMTYDDEVMFVLACGKKVYAKETAVVNGYVMPDNGVSAYSAVNTADGTDLFVKTDRMVPVNSATGPQNYTDSNTGRPYAVTGFEGEYLDFVFSDTPVCSGSFNVSGSRSVSGCEWLMSSEGNAVLRIRLAEPGRFYGHSFTLYSDGYYKITVNSRPALNSVKTVMLDPGHGGEDDSGTYSVYPGIYEKDVNLVLAYRVKYILEARGYNVVMTRTGDESVTLNDRMKAARTAPDIFVSIHCDGDSSPDENGTHVFYYYNFAYPLAQSVFSSLSSAYKRMYAPGTAEYAKIDKGAKFFPYQVARIEECPSVLVECGFLTNVYDSYVLLTENGQTAVASAVADGIDNYFRNY